MSAVWAWYFATMTNAGVTSVASANLMTLATGAVIAAILIAVFHYCIRPWL